MPTPTVWASSLASAALYAGVLLPSVTAAQKSNVSAAPPLSTKTVAALQAEPYVVRSFVSRIHMNADGTGTRDQTVSVQLQSDAAVRLFGVVTLNFAKSSETGEFVYARARHPDGTVTETPASEAQEQPEPVTREAPTYSDLMTKQLPLRSLHVGDTVEWQQRVTVVHPDVPDQFWGQGNFAKGAVVLSEEHELSVPATAHVTVWTNPRARITPEESTADGRHTWTWRHAELSPTVGPAAEARKLADEKHMLTPEEELDLNQGPLPSVAWTTFPSWQAVGDWYRKLITGQNAPDEAVRARVAELTTGKATQLEKAQAVYAYVSTQIRYVAVSFGVGRLKPHSAADVFRNQFGDCKDKHTLLASMLGVIGVQADPVLIGAGVRFNAAVPSPSSFNHLITLATIDGKPAWLDSTNEVAPWRALLFGIRDHDALVVPSASPATVQRTPAGLPYPASMTVAVQSVLDNKLTSESEMTYVFHDDSEFGLRLALHSTPASAYPEAVQRMLGSFGFAGTTTDAVIENMSDTSRPLTIRFHYHRDHDPSWGENRVTIPFGPEFLPGYADDHPPTSAIDLSGPRTTTSIVDITLPQGWTATQPDAVHERAAFAEGNETYRLTGRELHAEKKLVVLRRQLPAKEIKSYQAWFEKANAGSVPFLALTPPGGVSTEASTKTLTQPIPDPATLDAAHLVASAGDSIRARDFAEATRLLDAAKALNPKQQGLWMGYAAVNSMQGKSQESEAFLRKEIEYHPDETKAFEYMAVQQETDKHHVAAMETLRMWVASAPTNPAVALAAVTNMEKWKEYPAALSMANAAIERLQAAGQDTTALKLATGRLRTKASQH